MKASSSAFYFTQSCAVLFHVTLPYSLMSSIHVLLCLPLCLVYALCVQSFSLWVHLSSCLPARWPAHLHFFDFISCIISCTSVFFLKSGSVTQDAFGSPRNRAVFLRASSLKFRNQNLLKGTPLQAFACCDCASILIHYSTHLKQNSHSCTFISLLYLFMFVHIYIYMYALL